MERLPSFVRELFWEDLQQAPDPERHADYIGVRVLEAGDERAVRWLLDRYGRERLHSLATSGRLRPSQERFWREVLGDGRALRSR